MRTTSNPTPHGETWSPEVHALGDGPSWGHTAGDEICRAAARRPDRSKRYGGERESCLRGQMEMVMRALGYSLQSVLNANPQLGDECELRVVVLRCGVDDDVQYGIDLGRQKALEEARKN